MLQYHQRHHHYLPVCLTQYSSHQSGWHATVTEVRLGVVALQLLLLVRWHWLPLAASLQGEYMKVE